MLSANLKRLRAVAGCIFLDFGEVPRRELGPGAAGDALIDMIIRTANGRLVAAEALGRREPVWTNLYRSA